MTRLKTCTLVTIILIVVTIALVQLKPRYGLLESFNETGIKFNHPGSVVNMQMINEMRRFSQSPLASQQPFKQ
jgi:hypothetical protein